MITKEKFIKFIHEYQSFINEMEEISKVISGSKYGLNLYDCAWYNSVGKMCDIFVESNFNEVGCDLIYWWLYEDVDHIITQDVNPDLFNGKTTVKYDVNNIEDLWNYLIKFKEDYFKNE